MGGTCVMRGCIPSKIWLRAASPAGAVAQGSEFGLELTVGKLDFTRWRRKRGVSNDIRMGMEALLANNGVDVIPGMAVVTSPTSVDVAGKRLKPSIIIATGSTLAKPEVPGLDQAAFTTDQLLDMTEAPASVLITDPTYIGVEMSTLLSILGSKVIYAVPGRAFCPMKIRIPASACPSPCASAACRSLPATPSSRLRAKPAPSKAATRNRPLRPTGCWYLAASRLPLISGWKRLALNSMKTA